MKRFVVVVVALIVLLLPLAAVQAQDSCAGVTILNESKSQIDNNAVCAAASKFVAKGHQVFIFVTDRSAGKSEDDWYAIRDEIEVNWGIYDKAADTFSKKAVAVELTTDTSKPWGQDFAFGEMLFKTPLDNDAVISQIEGSLKNQVMKGEVTTAIVNAFNAAYDKGYPPPLPTQVPMPTVVVSNETNIQIDLAPIMRGIGIVFLIVLGLVAGYFLTLKVIIPTVLELRRLAALRKQAAVLRNRIGSLLSTLSGSVDLPGLLSGDSPESTLIYALWRVNGGDKYADRDGEIKENIRRSQVALQKVFDTWIALSEEGFNPGSGDELLKLVSSMEILYLTIVGTTRRILDMTEAEQMALLDPLVVIPREQADVQLVEQIDQVLRRAQGGGLRIQLMVERAANVDSQGILGYIDLIKSALHELSVARSEGPGILKQAVELRQQLGEEIDFPEVMEGINPFAYPDALIAEATKAQADQLWFEVREKAEKARTALRRTPKVIARYAAELTAHEGRDERIEEIRVLGYVFSQSTLKMVNEVSADVAAVNQAIADGDYPQAEEFIRELAADSSQVLKELEALVALRNKNLAELARLANEAARVDKTRTEARYAFGELKIYPRSNWEEVADYFEAADAVLKILFDDPANEEDLASSIAKLNSMAVQQFDRAEQALVEAFSQLADAERKLKAVIGKLADVKRIERTISAAVAAAEDDIVKAKSRRDADDEKIDEAVDGLINQATELVAGAKKAITECEFTVADGETSSARQLANQAYASADEQATAIDRLYRELAAGRTAAGSKVSQALADFNNLTPAAQKAATGGSVNQAQAMYKQAQRAESSVSGQDRVLAKTLKMAVETYRRAEELASAALNSIRRDKAEYDGFVSAVSAAIASASSAITNAGQYVRDSDAGGAGSSALRRAQSDLPESPHYGESVDALERRRRAAEQAEAEARTAMSEARSRIRAAEEAREAERRRIAAIEAARRAREADEARRRSYSDYGSSSHSSSYGSSSHSSSFGSRSGGSSMGSSGRR